MKEVFTITRTFECNELLDPSKTSLVGSRFTMTIGRSAADFEALKAEAQTQAFGCRFILQTGSFRTDGFGLIVGQNATNGILLRLATVSDAGQRNQSLKLMAYIIGGLAYTGPQGAISIGLYLDGPPPSFNWIGRASQVGADQIGKTAISEELIDILKSQPAMPPMPSFDPATPVIDYVNKTNR